VTRANLGFLLGLGLMLGTAMCQYTPHPQSGEMQCGSGDKRCPGGYTCHTDNLCYLPEDLPSATPSTGGTTTAVTTVSTGGGGGAAGGATAVISSSNPVITGGQTGGATLSHASTPVVTGGIAGSSVVITTIAGGSSTSSKATAGAGGTSLVTSLSRVGGESGSSPSSSRSSSAGGGGGSTTSTSGGGGTPSGTTVTFSSGKGVGAMNGYGWIAYGTATTNITEPTCGTEKFTSTTKACAATTWATRDALCITAGIPALPASPTSSDYASNWGVAVGLDSTDANGPLGQSFTSVTIAVSGSPSSGLRAKVHLKGDAEGTDYCATYTSSAIAFTKFTKTCYDPASPGTAITAVDVPKIDRISIQVPSSSTAIDVKSLCITGITFK
jgi:hypothetical protein